MPVVAVKEGRSEKRKRVNLGMEKEKLLMKNGSFAFYTGSRENMSN